jgi:hypothetical protein
MQFRLRTLLIVLAILLSGLPVGCAKNFSENLPPKPPHERRPVYSLEVRHESGITNQGSLREEKDDVTLGGFRVQVKDEQITINGTKYGKLRPDDKVLIELDGRVFVNGIVREPE